MHPNRKARLLPAVLVAGTWLTIGTLFTVSVALGSLAVIDYESGGFLDHRGSISSGGGNAVFRLWHRGPCTVVVSSWLEDANARSNEMSPLVPRDIEALAGSPWRLGGSARMLVTTGWPFPALYGTAIVDFHAPAGPTVFSHEGCWMLKAAAPKRNWMNGFRMVPLTPRWGALVLDTVFWAGVAIAGFTLLRFVRRRRRLSLGLCANCGYCLKRQHNGPCPECGISLATRRKAYGGVPLTTLALIGMGSCVLGGGALYINDVAPDMRGC